ncbi:TnsA endonuclease N-terminal domain-containing protein [Shewanella frigidimarina]|uniref:Transposase n=1 Tax=Shewanella frigidimarina TaxID=56812 RepID=A0A106C2G7_SHEFR|nr:TnsA endonuclease N-terminal domain-containing protein [Shewanella frigidimarina]KVX03041.1 transposase [Shewanella frigidimarina]
MKERELKKTSKVMPRINFVSIKNNATRFCDSELEVARLLQLEFDDDIISYNTQPSSFFYTAYGKQNRYSPDTIIQHRVKGVYFEEVKPSSELNKEINIEKFKLLSPFFTDICGNELSLVSEKEIFNGDNIANLKRLYRYLSLELSENCDSLLSTLPVKTTFSALIDFCENNECDINDPLILLAKKHYSFDITVLLSPTTNLVKADDSIHI